MAAGKIRKKIKKELIGTSDYPSNKIFTISNFITFTRLILTGVFLYLFVTDFNRYVALVIYAVAASTDWLDGQIARMTKTVSWLGKLLDPIVDRALLFCGVVGLVAREELPLWICLAIVGRDIYLFLGNFVVKRYHKRPIDVVFVGKLATALLMSGFTPHAARPARPRRPVHRPRFAHVASRAQLHARPARHLLCMRACAARCSPASCTPSRACRPSATPSPIPRTRTRTSSTRISMRVKRLLRRRLRDCSCTPVACGRMNKSVTFSRMVIWGIQ